MCILLLLLFFKIICCSGVSLYNSKILNSGSLNQYSNFFLSGSERNPYISIASSYQFVSSYPFVYSQKGEKYISTILSNNFISSTKQYSLSSIIQKTLAPTFAPSLAPSTLAPQQITFDTTVTLIGFSQSSLNELEQTVYIIALSKSTNIDQNYMKIIKQQIAGRRLLHNIDVTTQITYPYISNPQSVYQYLVQQIQTSVEKGNFSNYLTMISLQYNVSSFKNISIIGLSFSPLVDENKGTTTGSSDHTILIIMCISIVFSIWLLAIFCITQCKKQKDRYKNYLYTVYL